MTSLYWKLPTPTRVSVTAADLRRTLLEAFAVDVETERFFKAVRSAARARQHALGGDSAMLSFALNILLPVRTRGTERYLRREAVDRETFGRFLRFSEEVGVRAINAASTSSDLADAVIAALDDLHSYLLAHELVGEEYVKTERALAERIAPNDEPIDDAPTDSDDDPPEDSDVLHAAPKNNLALAA